MKCAFKECRRPSDGLEPFPEFCEECRDAIAPEIECLSDKSEHLLDEELGRN